MPFTVTDFHDLVRLLYDYPEWRAEMRRLVLTEEILELPALVRQLVEEHRAFAEEQRAFAEAQRRTEERVGRLEIALAELAEAQRRTEERVGRLEIALAELAEAQRRTEERVGRLEIALAELAEAQRRTEERVGRVEERLDRTEEHMSRLEIALAELAEAQRRTEISLQKLSESHAKLEKEFGQFRAIFGATVEDEASGVLRSVLEEKGYRPLGESFNLALDGEADVVLPVATPEREILWAIVEAKARLSRNDVRAWADRMKSEGWQRRLAKRQVTGPYLVYAFGIRVDRSAIEEAQRQGIGLLTGQGERVAPQGWIIPRQDDGR